MLLVYLVSGINENDEHPVGIQAAEQVLRPRGESEDVLAHTASISENDQLFKLLNDAYFEAQEYPKGIPIVFVIDAHGSEDGIYITGNPIIPWKALTGYFCQLNKYSKMNLILILGSCHGLQGLKMIESGEPAPFLCLFGPRGRINSYKLQCFYRDFFTMFLNNKKLDDILKPLMEQYRDEIYFSTASGMLKEVYKKYYGNKHSLERQRKRLSKKLKKTKRLSTDVVNERLHLLRDEQKFSRKMFDEFTSKFFMFDEIPENKSRYSYFNFDNIVLGNHIDS
ncbi:MAG: hypothetical protein M0Z90_00770 [Desulfobacteraceae bacterium]|nr:hypothetical protein [Desulfobacteraceae bacterium]